jgi:phosphoglycolate phosphatase
MPSPSRQPIKGVLFDLDGTLLDTAPDLINAVNRALIEAGFPDQPAQRLKPLISRGAAEMIRAGVPSHESAFDAVLDRALSIYRDNVAVETQLFDGMGEVLDTLERQGMIWGIVTNKLSRFTDPLIDALGLADRAGCVISGDTTDQRKPHPLPLTEACKRAGLAPRQCVYVGDARIDIEAGRQANMTTLAALYGYIDPGDAPESWGADAAIEKPADLLNWLNLNAAD